MATITCREFLAYLEPWMEGEHSQDAQAHLRTCRHCSSVVSDLESIHTEASSWSGAEQDAPERVWTSLRAQLEQEGLIRDAIPAHEDAAKSPAPRAGRRLSRGARRRSIRAQRPRQQARQRSALAERHASFHVTAQRPARFRRTKFKLLRHSR